jgi:hypothetical protein
VTDGTIQEVDIDLGFVVDALGKSVARIHNISVQFATAYATSNANFTSSFELGTQSAPNTYLTPADKSIISTGAATGASDSNGLNMFISQALDVAPQDWTNGYLVGVDSLYLRSSGVNAQGAIYIVLECTVETMSQSAAMSLALSQQ